MKKFCLLFLAAFMVLFLVGCSKNDEGSIVKNINNTLKEMDSYYLSGDLSIYNNDDQYSYEVEVYYKKNDFYRVNLVNKENNHEQIILKSNNEVYVITPSLNKSFKFQSNWPNDSSQVYLIASLYEDIFNSNDRVFEKSESGYIFNLEANYPNNSNLVKQTIEFDKDLNLKSVKVYNDNEVLQMSMDFNSIILNKSIDDGIFDLNNIISDRGLNREENENTSDSNSEKETDEEKDASDDAVLSIDDIIYPLYIPSGTVLTDEEKVSKTDGERIILTFDGEKPFILVEETVSIEKEFSIVPTYGDPYLMLDSVATLSDNSISWVSNGIEYYLVSDVMSQIELVEIANSVTTIEQAK